MNKAVTKELNQLLASAKVFYQNLHNFHWNIQCMHFFVLHGQLGELYDAVGTDIDEFAERILQLGGTPISTYSEYLRMSGIPERPIESRSDKIIQAVLEDLYATEKQLNMVRKLAVAADDEGTNTMMGDKLLGVQKAIWMWSALIHEKPNLERGISEPTGSDIPEDNDKQEVESKKNGGVVPPKRIFKRA